MNLITKQDELEEFCKSIKDEKFITVDTEFLRNKTYYPKLCLIQIASNSQSIAIDPLYTSLNLDILFQIFKNEKILKIFHSARQDIEAIYYVSNIIPNPIFDTQIAAMVCGYGESVSYESLVNQMLNINIDKTARHTNWAHRPLTDKQIEYAIGDVTYLRDLYIKLNYKLLELNRTEWIQEEIDLLTDINTYESDINNVWKKIKVKNKEPKFLSFLQQLASWRERNARELNIPREHFIKSDYLVKIASIASTNIHKLDEIKNFKNELKSQNIIDEITKLIKANQDIIIESKNHLEEIYESNLITQMLNILLKTKADELGIVERLIISKKDLSKFANSTNSDDFKVMHGWRYEIFGKYALLLKSGKIALTLEDSRIKIVNI